MKLNQAISDLQWIQERLERSEQATCFRSSSLAILGALALLSGLLQPQILVSNSPTPFEFVAYWSVVAASAIGLIFIDIVARGLLGAGTRELWQIQQILLEFGPCVFVGGIVSYAVVLQAPQFADIIPTHWGICFCLGLCAVRHRLPGNPYLLIGYYLIAALVCLPVANAGLSRSPWCVSLMFGIGQLMAAGVFYRNRERIRA